MTTSQDLHTGKMIGTASERDGLYFLNSQPTPNLCTVTGSYSLWHQRTGRPSQQVSFFIPVFKNNGPVDHYCLICPLAKQTRTSFPIRTSTSSSCFDIVHMDIWGGYHIPCLTGTRYFLTIVDDYSKFTWIYLMKNKAEGRPLIIHFLILTENQFAKRAKIIHSDNGPEFKCIDFYSSKGILHQTSCVNTPQQNGVAERKHRHLLNVACALLFQSHLPKVFWGDAILTATYLINRMPSRILENKTPFEMLFCKQPIYSHLRVFGCRCFASTHPLRPNKFEPRSIECIFLGYPPGTKGYKLYDFKNKKTFISRDVLFYKNEFPFSTTPDLSTPAHDLPLPSFQNSAAIYDDTQADFMPLQNQIDASQATPTTTAQNETQQLSLQNQQ